MHAARKNELELLLKKRDGLARNTAIQRRRLPISHLKSWIQEIVSRAYLRWQVAVVQAKVRKLRSVAIIRFSRLLTAHLVLQAAVSSEPFKMKAHILSDRTYDDRRHIFKSRLERSIHSISIAVVLNVLEIMWAVPIAMTGLLSQVSYLDTISIDLADLSEWQVSAIQGLAPQAALSLLMYCFPYIICALSNFHVHFQDSSVETFVQRHYFTFLYVQLFLVVSISSGVITMIPDLVSGFQSIPLILARNLPKSCNYFFSYLILQAVVQTSTILFQLPDGLWRGLRRGQAKDSMKRVRWSLVYPVFANLICICIIFSLLSPLILPIGLLTFKVFLILYSYQATYVLESDMETSGLLYWEAVNYLFLGIYIMDLCLIGFFALQNAVGPTIMAATLLLGVALVHKHLRSNLSPLINFVSCNIITGSMHACDLLVPS